MLLYLHKFLTGNNLKFIKLIEKRNKYFFAEKVTSAIIKITPAKVKIKFSAYSLSNDIFHDLILQMIFICRCFYCFQFNLILLKIISLILYMSIKNFLFFKNLKLSNLASNEISHFFCSYCFHSILYYI